MLLTEYEVGNVTVERQVDRDYSLAVISITFYRRFWFYVTSAYLPTVMLMMISYASLFIKRENDDLRVMMTLTTLLVLYALYQQISDGLPRTSYTKAVDVWCFFAITFIFTKVRFAVGMTSFKNRYFFLGIIYFFCICFFSLLYIVLLYSFFFFFFLGRRQVRCKDFMPFHPFFLSIYSAPSSPLVQT